MQDIYVILVGPKKNNNYYSEHNPLRNILFFLCRLSHFNLSALSYILSQSNEKTCSNQFQAPFYLKVRSSILYYLLWFQIEDMCPSLIQSRPQGITQTCHVLIKRHAQGFKKYRVEYKTGMRFQLDQGGSLRSTTTTRNNQFEKDFVLFVPFNSFQLLSDSFLNLDRCFET